jgi:hypothetical protein
MARAENTAAVTQHIVTDEDTPRLSTMVEAANQLAAMDHAANENALAVARQFGYDGALTVGALEDEIRFYQRRTVEGVLELGKRLLLLRELTPFGEFENRVRLLGFDPGLARKFMSATAKFSNRENFTISKINNQSKLLELLVLDNDEIDVLESGETVRGVTLDKIETMSASELKKALREANDRIDAKDKVIKDKSAKIDEQAEKLASLGRQHKPKPIEEQPMPGEYQLSRLQEYARDLTTRITATLNSEIVQLYKVFEGQPPKHIELAARQAVGLVITAAYGVAENMGIDPILEPEQAADDPAKADAEAFLAYQAAQEQAEA